MRALIAAALMVLAGAAQAWCSMPPPPNPSTVAPVQREFTSLLCLPAAAGIPGSGRGYLQRDFPAVPGATAHGGSAWGWWCQLPDQTWRAQTFACLDKYCPGTAAKAVAAALVSASPQAALQSVADQYTVRVTDWSETHDYNCLHSNMVAALQATKPSDGPLPSVWRVPSGGSAVYPVVNGKLGLALPGRRAAGNTLCDLNRLKVVVGAYTYAAFETSGPNEVALCVKVST